MEEKQKPIFLPKGTDGRYKDIMILHIQGLPEIVNDSLNLYDIGMGFLNIFILNTHFSYITEFDSSFIKKKGQLSRGRGQHFGIAVLCICVG